MNESVGSEGGFFIQPDLLPGVIDPVYTEDPILSRVTRIPIGALERREVQRRRRDGAHDRLALGRHPDVLGRRGRHRDGVEAEAAPDGARPQEAHRIAYLTDELMQDAPAAEALLTRASRRSSASCSATRSSRHGRGAAAGLHELRRARHAGDRGTQTIANTNASSPSTRRRCSPVPAWLWNE
jgi:hypothetical protein